MLYAKVVLGLPVEGPFDYSVPDSLFTKIKVGMRVWVSFRTRKMLGYVVKLSRRTDIKNIKPILELIDDFPVLDKNILSLTKELSEYYCCSWGQAIETALPEALRKGKKLNADSRRLHADSRGFSNEQNLRVSALDLHKSALKDDIVLIHDLEAKARWDTYLKSIKEAINSNRSAIVLLADINSVLKAKEIISTNLDITPLILYRKQPKELEEWIRIKQGGVNIIIGTRSSIFAPINNPGLIIIDAEEDSIYKQDQVPHYHAKEVAFMRIKFEKAKLILGSASPSLESIYLAKMGKIKYMLLPRIRNFPEIKIITMPSSQYYLKPRAMVFSKYLEDSIIQTLDLKGKILLFLNRRGFATFASCQTCGKILKCPRCNINLVYHFKNNLLSCHYCNFRIQAPKICPDCRAGYIKYAGTGTEKVESELSRIFPGAKIKRLDSLKEASIDDADIFISTESIIGESKYNFALIGTLFIDNSLNRLDFRATEKTFDLLVGLMGLTEKKMIIQTGLAHHYCFKALENKDINMFYNEELKQRKELKFPPYQHIGLVKLRGKKEDKVRETSNGLFNRLNKYVKDNKTLKVISVNPGQPAKLRGNFYWQILLKSGSAYQISKFLKIHLKNFSHSGIIVTVDIDPL